MLAGTGAGFAALAARTAGAEITTLTVPTQRRSGTMEINDLVHSRFTGSVRLDPLFQAPEPARVPGSSVTFEPGARTVWHTHPLGQTLIVTSGCGWVQRDGGPIEEIRPGRCGLVSAR
jgi:quercetin dioxygenase-like cupin family protein